MRAHKLRQALGFIIAGFVLGAAISVVSAQVGLQESAEPSAAAEIAAATVGAGAAAVVAASEATAVSAEIGLSAAAASAVMGSEEGSDALAEEGAEATVAQAPPVAPEGQTTAATQPILINEREWSDAHKTIVECTGDVARTCQVNVYGPNGEFILGRTISPNGEAVDCSGPCLDSTGAPLDASSVIRAQAAIDAGSQTHKIITSAGTPLAPATAVPPAETEAQEPLRAEGE
jgi:hypothetical protein